MQQILNFLEQLEINNKREWFHGHQDEYKSAKKDLLELIVRLIK